MRKKFAGILTGVIFLFLVLDLYLFISIKKELFVTNIYFPIIFWLVTVIFLIYFGYVLVKKPWKSRDPARQRTMYGLMGLLILIYFPKILTGVIFLIDDFLSMIFIITDRSFTSHAIIWSGLCVGILSFLLVLYGIVIGKYHFKVEKLKLSFSDLPSSFNGLEVVHISDLHIGSWNGDYKQLKKAVKIINSLEPDIIVFTGDLVNNFVEELKGFKPILSELSSRLGKYSVLGNHDYGDYSDWPTRQAKKENLHKLMKAHEEMGFRLLLNDSEVIEAGGKSIGIVGVENWGVPPFRQNGDLERAIESLDKETDFNILLSHDPSHWKQEVVHRPEINLILSGHTHGMQFGIYTRNRKWSPAKLKYKEWGGLYQWNSQKLYVSTGLGYIGFPGRIGIRPRITKIILEQK